MARLSDLLAHRARLTPDREAMVGAGDADGRRLTWAEADAECTRLAGWFRDRGIVAGDRVALLAKNSIEAALAVFAASRAGAIVVVLNWRLAADELAYILADSGARALFHDAELTALADAARAEGCVEVLLSRGASEGRATYEQAVRHDGSGDAPESDRGGDDVAVIMYTSGTTGRPKGAMLSHDNFLWAALGVTATIAWPDTDRFLLVAPLFHIGGLVPLMTSVQRGNAIVFMADFDPVAVWRTIADERITTAMLVPVMLQALDTVAGRMPVHPSSLVSLSCGASAVSSAMIDAWARRGVAVQQVYGLTEVTGALTYWTPAMGLEHRDTQGRSVYLVDLKVVDPSSRATLSAGVRGEVVARGPSVFRGYWRNDAATGAAMDGAWFATGDIGYFDEHGFLRLVDRLKDLIISGGENIYPAEVEAVLVGHPDVAEAAIAGRLDARWGEVPVAYVVPAGGREPDEAALLGWCRDRLAGFKCPRAVTFVEALPRNGAGKVLKRPLAALHSSGDASA